MARKLEVDFESDLPKITGKDYKSPVKFELEIQRQRVLYILHCAVKKMSIMACLPMLLENDGEILQKFLTDAEFNFVKFACSKYMREGKLTFDSNSSNYATIIDNIALNQIGAKERNLKSSLLGSLSGTEQFVDYHISEVVNIITSNVALIKFISGKKYEIEERICNIIDCMKHLKELIHERLMITSQEQMEKDKQLRQAYKSNFTITKNIHDLNQLIEKQRRELGTELDKKNAILDAYIEKITSLQEEFDQKMLKKMQKSERKMMKDSLKSEVRQLELENESQEFKTKYSKLLETDLNEEAQLRQKRNKVEAQLASWIAKYDNDVGEKNAEFEKLDDQYNQMKDQYDRLTDKLEDQSTEYEILMAERDEEEYRLHNIVAIEFLKNRSARRIQRAWRAYWQRKMDRRKARKGKKKEGAKRKSKKDLEPKVTRKTDAVDVLEKTFKKKKHLFEEIDTTKEFPTEPAEVAL